MNKSASSLIAIAIGSSNVALIDPRVGSAIQQIRCIKEPISSVRWLSVSDFILSTGARNGFLSIWDIRSSYSRLAQLNITENMKGGTLVDEIADIQDTDDGLFFIISTKSGRILVFDSILLKEIAKSKVKRGISNGNFSMAYENNSLFCFVPTENNIATIRFKLKNYGKEKINPEIVQNLLGHFKPVSSCAYRNDHQQLVTSGYDHISLVWAPKIDEFRSHEESHAVEKLYEDAFSDDDE